MVDFQESRPGHYTSADAITASDSLDLTNTTSAVWIGAAGNLRVNTQDGTTVTITGIPAGTLLKIAVTRVFATGTTVAGGNIIGLR